jgi:LPXTG-motif cell wall-anchored protein
MIAQNTASDQNGAATDQNNAAPAAAPSATDQNAPAAAAPADQNAPASNSNGGTLPQTGSELPLLGLLGLGTVSAGVWKAYYKK